MYIEDFENQLKSVKLKKLEFKNIHSFDEMYQHRIYNHGKNCINHNTRCNCDCRFQRKEALRRHLVYIGWIRR